MSDVDSSIKHQTKPSFSLAQMSGLVLVTYWAPKLHIFKPVTPLKAPPRDLRGPATPPGVRTEQDAALAARLIPKMCLQSGHVFCLSKFLQLVFEAPELIWK